MKNKDVMLNYLIISLKQQVAQITDFRPHLVNRLLIENEEAIFIRNTLFDLGW